MCQKMIEKCGDFPDILMIILMCRIRRSSPNHIWAGMGNDMGGVPVVISLNIFEELE